MEVFWEAIFVTRCLTWTKNITLALEHSTIKYTDLVGPKEQTTLKMPFHLRVAIVSKQKYRMPS